MPQLSSYIATLALLLSSVAANDPIFIAGEIHTVTAASKVTEATAAWISAAWNTGDARKRIIGSSAMEASEEECKVVHHPNKMVYMDDKGERQEIYMPARDFYKAIHHCRKKEWSELAKFPKWENQRYTDADNLKNITDPETFYSVLPLEDDDSTATADASKENDANERN